GRVRCPRHSYYALHRTRRPLYSPVFPYTTLFRSLGGDAQRHVPLIERFLVVVAVGENARVEIVRVGEVRVALQTAQRDAKAFDRSEEHTSELQSLRHLVCRLLLEKKKHTRNPHCL